MKYPFRILSRGIGCPQEVMFAAGASICRDAGQCIPNQNTVLAQHSTNGLSMLEN